MSGSDIECARRRLDEAAVDAAQVFEPDQRARVRTEIAMAWLAVADAARAHTPGPAPDGRERGETEAHTPVQPREGSDHSDAVEADDARPGWGRVETSRGTYLVPPANELVIVRLPDSWWFLVCPGCDGREVRAQVWDPTPSRSAPQMAKLVRCRGRRADGLWCRVAVPLEEARRRAVERGTLDAEEAGGE